MNGISYGPEVNISELHFYALFRDTPLVHVTCTLSNSQIWLNITYPRLTRFLLIRKKCILGSPYRDKHALLHDFRSSIIVWLLLTFSHLLNGFNTTPLHHCCSNSDLKSFHHSSFPSPSVLNNERYTCVNKCVSKLRNEIFMIIFLFYSFDNLRIK